LLRRKFAPRWVGWAALVAFIALLGGSWWYLQTHMMAVSGLGLHGATVEWDGRDRKWLHGGDTTVDFTRARSRVRDTDLAHLLTLHRVVSVNLAGCGNISSAGVATLRKLKHLESLDLSRDHDPYADYKDPHPIDDAALEEIKGSVALKELALRFTKVSDSGLAHLQGLRNLESLDLTGTPITDAGLQRLKGMKHLKLVLLENSRVTQAAIMELQQVRPELEVRSTSMTSGAPQ
jgi:hypothetical protein